MQSWNSVLCSPEETRTTSELKLAKPNDSKESVTIIQPMLEENAKLKLLAIYVQIIVGKEE